MELEYLVEIEDHLAFTKFHLSDPKNLRMFYLLSAIVNGSIAAFITLVLTLFFKNFYLVLLFPVFLALFLIPLKNTIRKSILKKAKQNLEGDTIGLGMGTLRAKLCPDTIQFEGPGFKSQIELKKIFAFAGFRATLLFLFQRIERTAFHSRKLFPATPMLF